MPKRVVFERSRRELSLNVSVDVHVLLVVEQSSLESQSSGCAKTSILTAHTSARRPHSTPLIQSMQEITLREISCKLHYYNTENN